MNFITFSGYGVNARDVTVDMDKVTHFYPIDYNGNTGTTLVLDNNEEISVSQRTWEISKTVGADVIEQLQAELAKAQPVLDAAEECASFYEEHIDLYNPEDTRGFDIGEAMRLLCKCNEAVRKYKERASDEIHENTD